MKSKYVFNGYINTQMTNVELSLSEEELAGVKKLFDYMDDHNDDIKMQLYKKED